MSDKEDGIKTPETHPVHPVIGWNFAGYDGKFYYCDSYDPRIGFWVQEIGNPENRKNISERAIGRTFHVISEYGECQYGHFPEYSSKQKLVEGIS